MACPHLVRSYSTFGGTCGYTVRLTMPSRSKLAKLLDQHFLRHARNSLLQFGETQGAASEEMEDDDHLPTPLQHAERLLDAARRHIGGDVFELTCR